MEPDRATQENKEREEDALSMNNNSIDIDEEPMLDNGDNSVSRAKRKKTPKKQRAKKKSPKVPKAPKVPKGEKNDPEIAAIAIDPKVIIILTKRSLNGKRRSLHWNKSTKNFLHRP